MPNIIFSELNISKLKLKNRIIRSATFEAMADRSGNPTENLTNYYQELLSGGTSAVITGFCAVSDEGRAFPTMLTLINEDQIDSHAKMINKLDKNEAYLIVQLAHGGSLSNGALSGKKVLGASGRAKNQYGNEVIKASSEDIKRIISDFVVSAVNAVKSGYDGVQLHGAHGYLLSEFVSPVLNKRNDEWGGSIGNRLRIFKEIAHGIKEKLPDFPLLVKLSSSGGDSEEFDNEIIEIAKLIESFGYDAIEISCGYGNIYNTIRMKGFPEDAVFNFSPYYKDLPDKKLNTIKKITEKTMLKYLPINNYNTGISSEIYKNINIPLIVVGGIRNMESINNILNRKQADFVSMSRPFIIENDIVNKFGEKTSDSSSCIDCGYCIFGIMDQPIKCYYGKI